MTYISRVIFKTYIPFNLRDYLDEMDMPMQAGRAIDKMYTALRELEKTLGPGVIEQTALAEKLNHRLRRGSGRRR